MGSVYFHPLILTHTQHTVILDRVAAHETTPFRPYICETANCPPDLLELMGKCWADNPDERLPFSTIRTMVRHIMK